MSTVMEEIADGPLLVRREETTVVLTLNRPEQRNALNEEVLRLLRDALAAAERDPSVRALVVTGSGDRAFCAGADIRQMTGMDVVQGREWSLLGHDVFQRIEDLPKPVVAAINGTAVGGGCELALACDFRFIAEGALLGQPEIKLGMIPGWGGTQRLPRIVGAALAKDLVLTGRMMAADEALRVGLVSGTTPPGAVMEQALVYARQFAQLPPLAVGFAKQAIEQGADLALREANLLEAELFARSFATEDRAEGLAAFLEKRPPRFQGK
jgi:enoyl-CoA hydratase